MDGGKNQIMNRCLKALRHQGLNLYLNCEQKKGHMKLLGLKMHWNHEETRALLDLSLV